MDLQQIKNRILQGNVCDVLPQIEKEIINCIVTSPPYYGLRDYGLEKNCWPKVVYRPLTGMQEIEVDEWVGCLGLEPTPEMYVAHIVLIARELYRVLRRDGTFWINIGDSYEGSGKGKTGKDQGELKNKDLIGIPWRVAFALQADGWYLRMDNIWNKPNAMPESVKDRPTKAHEYVFLLSKSKEYYYDFVSIKEKAINGDSTSPRGSKGVFTQNSGRRKQDLVGKRQYEGFNQRYKPVEFRNKRSVWNVSTKPFAGSHFATFPKDLIEVCILAGSPINGIVLDPFMGSGTTAVVAKNLGRNFFGIEANETYIKEIALKRIENECKEINLFYSNGGE